MTLVISDNLTAHRLGLSDKARYNFDSGRGPLKPASIAHLLSSLASLHVRVLEEQNPTKDVIVKSEIKRLRREMDTAQDQAVALRANHDVPLPASSTAKIIQITVPSIAKLHVTCDVATPRVPQRRTA